MNLIEHYQYASYAVAACFLLPMILKGISLARAERNRVTKKTDSKIEWYDGADQGREY